MLNLTTLGATPVLRLDDDEVGAHFARLGWTIDATALSRFTAARARRVVPCDWTWMGLMTFQPYPSSNFNEQAAQRAAAVGLRLATPDECGAYLLHHARSVGRYSVYAQGDVALRVEGDCLDHVLAVRLNAVTTVITNSGTRDMLCLVTGPSPRPSYRAI